MIKKWFSAIKAPYFSNNGEVMGVVGIMRDVTEMKKTEAALRESEQRFRTLVAASKDPIFYVGTQGDLLYGSPSVETVFGYPITDWTNENVIKFLHPSSVPVYEQFWEYFKTHGKFPEDSLEITWIKADGSFLHSDQRYSNVYGHEGKVTGFVTVSRDITHRKRSEERILEKEAFKRNILNSLPAHIVVLDQHGTIVATNEGWDEFAFQNGWLGNKGAGLGMNYLAVCDQAIADNVREAGKAKRAIESVLKGQSTRVSVEYECHSPRERRWFLMMGTPLGQGERGAVISHIDITQRKLAEQLVARLNRDHHLILGSVKEGIYGLDLEGKVTFVNPAGARMIGYEPEEFIGKVQHDILHHSRLDGTPYAIEDCPIYAAFEGGEAYSTADEVFWRRDGTCFPVEYRSTPIRDEQGLIIGAVVTFYDITERKKAEEALRDSEERFRTLVTLSNDPIFYVGVDQTVLYASPSVEQVFGYAADDWRKEDLPSRIHPSCLHLFEEHWKYYYEHGYFKEGPLQFHWIKKNGTSIFTDQQITNIYDKKGKVSGFLTVVRDVTERKKAEEAFRQSEERFRTIVTLSKDAVFYLGMDRSFLYVSPSAESIFQYTPQEWSYALLERIIHPSSKEAFKKFWEYFETYGKACEDPLEVNWIRKDGRMIQTEHSFSNVYDHLGKVVSFVSIVKDVTDRNEAQIKLGKTREEIIAALRQSDSMKSAVLSSISHEIRTPLAAIKAMVYSSPEGQGDGSLIRREFLEGMNQEIDYLSRMLDNLLDMSRLESGKIVPTREWYLIEDLIEGAIQRLGKSVAQRELDLVLDDTLPPVLVDGIEIQQVLINVLDNAVKYSLPASVIHLIVGHHHNMVEFRVTNQGAGVPLKERERVFERFYRCASMATKRTRGTGLGLAICKEIVKSHNGKIWMESDDIRDVAVVIQLPIEQSYTKPYALV